jgi:hypothetical protein
MLWYRTEIQDADMRLLAASASMPIPSYAIQTPQKPFAGQQNMKK